MSALSTREIASVIWFALFIVIVLMMASKSQKASIGQSFRQLLKTTLDPHLVFPALAMTIYVVLITWSLYALGIWQVGVLKETVLWFFVTLPVAFQLSTADRDKNIWTTYVADNFKILVIVQFILETYTFALWKEMLIVPFVTLVLLLDVVASSNPEHRYVSRFLKGIQAFAIVTILLLSISAAVADYRNLGSLNTVRSLLIVPALSIAFVPFIYSLRLYANYELLFKNLGMGIEKSTAVKRYAQRRLILRFGLSNAKVLAFIRSPKRRELYQIENRADVDKLLNEGT